MASIYGFHVGKYSNPMDCLGMFLPQFCCYPKMTSCPPMEPRISQAANSIHPSDTAGPSCGGGSDPEETGKCKGIWRLSFLYMCIYIHIISIFKYIYIYILYGWNMSTHIYIIYQIYIYSIIIYT